MNILRSPIHGVSAAVSREMLELAVASAHHKTFSIRLQSRDKCVVCDAEMMALNVFSA